ncbi:MAG TPA: hypothetical protein VMG60_16595 [Burkholderiaceae bacterium]|nr:hypothetical protein [Burkholderiaceae bacterium]
MNSRTRAFSQSQQEALQIYARLLDEAAVRISGIDAALNGQTGLPVPLIAEFGYLQLRMLGESIALACLVAHGDIKETITTKLQKEFAADSIIKALERLHANFYPRPVVVRRTATGVHIERSTAGFLTRRELVDLYHQCGDRLHRGSLVKFRSEAPRRMEAERVKLRGWREKFVALLTTHHIASLDGNTHYLCFLSHPQTNGKPMIARADSIDHAGVE